MLSDARLVKKRGYALAFSHDYVQDGSRHRRKDVEVRRFHKCGQATTQRIWM